MLSLTMVSVGGYHGLDVVFHLDGYHHPDRLAGFHAEGSAVGVLCSFGVADPRVEVGWSLAVGVTHVVTIIFNFAYINSTHSSIARIAQVMVLLRGSSWRLSRDRRSYDVD